jgi:hypothetical protein
MILAIISCFQDIGAKGVTRTYPWNPVNATGYLENTVPKNIGYDAAGEFLKFTLVDLQPRTDNWRDLGTLETVSTKAYQSKGLDESMFLYIPNNCMEGGCKG